MSPWLSAARSSREVLTYFRPNSAHSMSALESLPLVKKDGRRVVLGEAERCQRVVMQRLCGNGRMVPKVTSLAKLLRTFVRTSCLMSRALYMWHVHGTKCHLSRRRHFASQALLFCRLLRFFVAAASCTVTRWRSHLSDNVLQQENSLVRPVTRC